MLNTIYEEFDFESKIKDLKNKRIKIRRIAKIRDENLGSVINQSLAPTLPPKFIHRSEIPENMLKLDDFTSKSGQEQSGHLNQSYSLPNIFAKEITTS